MMQRKIDTITLAGFNILSAKRDAIQTLLLDRYQCGLQTALFFANTNFVVQCQPLRSALNNPDTVIINDGVGMDIAAALMTRRAFKDNLNGTDFIPGFLQQAGDTAKVFLLGAAPGVAANAANTLQTQYHIDVVGHRNGFNEAQDTDSLIADINASGANVLLVAMGNPKQEAWIAQHREVLAPVLLMGVGALLDFLAGNVSRAPQWIRKLRLEWLYRLSLEPNRLLRRYTLDIFVFLKLCLNNKKPTTAASYD